jgi:hypothetical protein
MDLFGAAAFMHAVLTRLILSMMLAPFHFSQKHHQNAGPRRQHRHKTSAGIMARTE